MSQCTSIAPEKRSSSSASPNPKAPRERAADGTRSDAPSDYHEDASSSYLYKEDREDDDADAYDEEEEEQYEEEDAQEALLSFSQFVLDPAMAEDHHRIVAFHCFRHFIAVGTNQGFVLVFDSHQQQHPVEGKRERASLTSSTEPSPLASTVPMDASTTPTYAALRRVLHHHTEPVQEISCTADERYLASIDKSGTVAIQSLADDADVWVRMTEQPLSSVALHPLYGTHDEKPFVCASGEKVFLWTRSSVMLGHRRSVALSDPHGKVHRIRWCHSAYDLIAWLAERGVCVYDFETRQLLRFIPRPTQGTIRTPALYPASLAWDTLGLGHDSPIDHAAQSHNTTVLCWGWADWVQEVHLTPSSASVGTSTARSAKANTASSRWQVKAMPGILTASAGAPIAAASTERESTSMATSPTPDRHLYPESSGLAPQQLRSAASPAAASGVSQAMGADAHDSVVDGELAMRVCGLLPFGEQCYLVLAAMVGPAAEAALVDLEVRIVARQDLSPLYRGRLLVPLVHPLQLSLDGAVTGETTAHVAGEVDKAKAAATAAAGPLSPYTSARASSLSSAGHVTRGAVLGGGVTTLGQPTASSSQSDSGLASHSRALSSPSPAPSPTSASFPTGSATKISASAVGRGGFTCHHMGLTPQEREASLRMLYADPSRVTHFPPDSTTYAIVALNTVVRAVPSQVDDHVAFLLAQGALREAYAYAKPRAHLLPNRDIKQIGKQLLVAMLDEAEESARRAEYPARSSSSLSGSSQDAETTIEDVLSRLPEVLQDDYAEWERWVYILDQRGDCWRIASSLPTSFVTDGTTPSPGCRIGAQYYGLVLLRCLEHDAVLFNDTLHRFEGLYDPDVVLKPLETRYLAALTKARTTMARSSVDHAMTDFDGAVSHTDQLRRAGTASSDVAAGSASAESVVDGYQPTPTLSFDEARLYALGEAYGRVLRQVGRDEEALEVLLRVERSRELFTFIRAKRLYGKALDILPGLFKRSAERTVQLLLEHATPSLLPQPASSDPEPREQGGPPTGGVAAATAEFPAACVAGRVDSTLVMSSPAVTVPRRGGPGHHTHGAFSHSAQSALNGHTSRDGCTGGPTDPLRPEQVVQRLQGSDRRDLWMYLVALRQAHPDVFSSVARRHAQLVAILYMDYSPQDLLAFLKAMSMYLDKMKEIYALCKKNQLIEEMLFIMTRLGKEEEGVRLIVEQQKNMRKAVDFVLSIPSRNEQHTLFRRLVDMAVATQHTLPLYHDRAAEALSTSAPPSHLNDDENANEAGTWNERARRETVSAASPVMPKVPPFSPKRISAEQIRYNRCVHYTPQRGESIASVSSRFDVPINDILDANHLTTIVKADHAAAEAPGAVAAPSPCVVPINLLAALLVVVSDPSYADHPAIDVRYVLSSLPEDEPLPGAAACVAAVLHSRAAALDFQETVLRVTETDLSDYYGHLLKRRTAAVRMEPTGLLCAHCGQREVTSFLPRDDGARRLAACRDAILQNRAAPSVTDVHLATFSEPASPWRSTHDGASSGAVSGSHERRPPQSPAATTLPGAIIFPCRHAYHPACLMQSLIADGCLHDGATHANSGDVCDFLAHPDAYAAPRHRRVLPCCRLCKQTAGVPGE